MVPIFHDPANPSAEVLAEEARIIKAEGVFTVNGVYFANGKDAATARRVLAETRVALAIRQQRKACAFCNSWIEEGEKSVEIAFRQVHVKCAERFLLWLDDHPSENDPRWYDVTDNTLVDFDGQPCSWGSLSTYEKKTVSMTPDGKLVGGYGVHDRFEITALGKAACAWEESQESAE